MTLLALAGLVIMGFFVALCIFLFVPFIIGKTASSVGGAITDRPLDLGCLGSIFVAILGAILGHILFGNFGPRVFDIYIVPAFLGSIIVTIILTLILNSGRRRRY